MMQKWTRAVSLVATGILLTVCMAEGAADCKEHPLIRPWPGSELQENCQYRDFDEYSFWVTEAGTGKEIKTKVQGKFWILNYILYDAAHNWDGSHSVLEYRENYKQSALEKSGTILYENGGYLTFTLPGDDGSTTWCEVHIWNKSMQDLRIIEVAGMKKSMAFGPAEMKAALDADGRVQLHGILFDLDQATLQPESVKQLQSIVTLMKDYPALKLEVQGHTDDQGADDYNLSLSQHRSESVVAFLGLFGIEKGRLIAKGYGESIPVAPNTTEDGRAQNRRVELVKLP
jgi:outer membrane protein OmpA-like peptidoglycan-associated protein